jgi:predicted RNase H-like nuclease (RuvC/YqgF family)
MMDDPNVNYHQAKKAFEEFWKDRGEPEEEEKHEHEKEKKERSVFKRLLKSDERLEEENRELSIPYRRFKKWLIDMEPYVQPDGSILSMDEQMKIWENARK